MLRLVKSNNVALPVKLRLPTETPDAFNEGELSCVVKILTKDEISALRERGAEDSDYIEAVLVSVSGLADEDGKPLEGDAALLEVKRGAWAPFLQPAITFAYFEQFGEARVKNSKTSRGR